MPKKFILLFLLLILVLSGCGNKFMEKAKETTLQNEIRKTERELQELDREKELDELYKSKEKPIDEVINDNDLDEREILDREDEIIYDPADLEDFAQYVGSILYSFQSLSLQPEEYYNFLSKDGSKLTIENLPDDEETAILIYSNIQSLYRQNQNVLEGYYLSEVELSQSNREASFYRVVETNNGNEYYITTLVKENDIWKFDDDSPSPPFQINEDEGD